MLIGAICAGCGGSSQQAAPAQAGASSSASAQQQGQQQAPVAVAEGDPAEKKLEALTHELEKLGKGEAIDRAWLEGELKGILKLNPHHALAQFNLGVLKERDGDRAGARKVYEEILERDATFIPAIENLAVYWVEEGKVDQAVEAYRKNIERDPKNVTSRVALARILASRKQYEEAVTLCRQALQRRADAIEAFRVLALSYNELGNVPMAELIIGRGFLVDKNDLELHYLVAKILFAKKDLAAGVTKLKEIIKLDPKWCKVRAQLADIALTYRDFGSAAQQLEAVVKEEPQNRAALNNLAVAYKGMGRYDQAEATYQKLLTINANDADVLWNLAVLYHRQMNEFDKAIATYNKVKALLGGDKEKVAELDKAIGEADRTKNDQQAKREREERERKKLEAIQAACAAVREGKAPDAAAIGNDQERIEVAWQLVVEGQGLAQQGDIANAEASAKCGFAIVPDSQGAKTEACAPMHVMWAAQVLYPLGRLEDALTTVREALACDANNPDAQLVEQQLLELIKQAKEQAAAAAAAGPTTDVAGQPASAGGAEGTPAPAPAPTP